MQRQRRAVRRGRNWPWWRPCVKLLHVKVAALPARRVKGSAVASASAKRQRRSRNRTAAAAGIAFSPDGAQLNATTADDVATASKETNGGGSSGGGGGNGDDDDDGFDSLFAGLSAAKRLARERAEAKEQAAAEQAQAARQEARARKRNTIKDPVFGEEYEVGNMVNPQHARVHRFDNSSGLNVFKAHALGLGQGGGTPLCPFDCNCCF